MIYKNLYLWNIKIFDKTDVLARSSYDQLPVGNAQNGGKDDQKFHLGLVLGARFDLADPNWARCVISA